MLVDALNEQDELKENVTQLCCNFIEDVAERMETMDIHSISPV